MPLIIIARCPASEKLVWGKPLKVSPVLACDGPGQYAHMGVGYSEDETSSGRVWGPAMPHKLIQSWRAMKLLEEVESIREGTLCHCWYAAGQKIHSMDEGRVDELAVSVGGKQILNELRAKVRQLSPSSDEIRSMLTILRMNDIQVTGWELEVEISAGRIEMLPEIAAIIEEEKQRHERYQRESEERAKKQPVARIGTPASPPPNTKPGFISRLAARFR